MSGVVDRVFLSCENYGVEMIETLGQMRETYTIQRLAIFWSHVPGLIRP